MKSINSTRNPKILELVRLREKSSFRRQRQVFLIEGIREVGQALANDYYIEEVFFCPQLLEEDECQNIKLRFSKIDLVELSRDVYDKVAVRGSTEGIVAVARMKDHDISRIKVPGNALILVAERVEKPGNLGALLRTADAANLDAVILCEPLFDLYNSNVIRSSIGCLFSLQVALCSTDDAIKWLKSHEITSLAASPQASVNYASVNFRKATAIVVGSEAEGLSQKWMDKATERIYIPMLGKADSLNVSSSAAIIIFEAIRQRMS